jgi:hypothetical protein
MIVSMRRMKTKIFAIAETLIQLTLKMTMKMICDVNKKNVIVPNKSVWSVSVN